jgi:hypothetical protein
MTSAAATRRVTLALTAATLLAGCGDDPPKRDATGAIEQPGEARLLSLRAGDCMSNFRDRLEHPDGGHNGVPKVTAVSCSAEHDAEILRIARLDDGEWPGYEVVDGEAAGTRQELHPRLVRIKQADGALTLVSFRPSEDRWNFEDQRTNYFVALYKKPRHGSAPK